MSSFINDSIFKNMAVKDLNKEIIVTNTDNNNLSFHSSSSDENVDTMSIKTILNKTLNMDLEICSFNNNTLSPVITINNNNRNCVIKENVNMSNKIISNVDTMSIKTILNKTPNMDLDICSFNNNILSPVITINNNNQICVIKANVNMSNKIISNLANPSSNGDAVNLEWYNTWTPTDLGDLTDSADLYAKKTWTNTQLTGYSATSHNHSGVYATASHTHSGYASSSHTHSNYLSSSSWPYGRATVGGGSLTIGPYGTGAGNFGGYASAGCHITIGDNRNYNSNYHGYLWINGHSWAWAWSTHSDDRIKKNEKLITNSTETLMKLRPQLYFKNFDENTGDEDINEAGLIAQEIYYEVPELRFIVTVPTDAVLIDDDKYRNFEDIRNDPDYSNWGEGTASVNYTNLIAYLIKGFQEQQEIMENQNKKITELESKNSELESKINELFSIVNQLK